jgi:hypothetical protein
MGLLYLIIAILSKRKGFWRNCVVLAIISGLITVGWDVYNATHQPELAHANWSTFDWSETALPAVVDFFIGFIQVFIGFGLVWICKRLSVWRKGKTAPINQQS